MKTESTQPIPTTEYLTPAGPWRFNYNFSTSEREGETIYHSDTVEVAELTKEAIVVAMIRTRYSMNEEAALHRKMLANESGVDVEFAEYNLFVNECKAIVNADGIV